MLLCRTDPALHAPCTSLPPVPAPPPPCLSCPCGTRPFTLMPFIISLLRRGRRRYSHSTPSGKDQFSLSLSPALQPSSETSAEEAIALMRFKVIYPRIETCAYSLDQ